MPTFDEIADRLSAPVAEVMRTQGPTRRLLPGGEIDDATILELLELAGHASSDSHRRCEFVVVRDPEVKHQLARANRQGWSVYKRVLRTRSQADDLLESRQWLADHFEDVPVIVVVCVHGRRPLFPAIGASAFYGSAFPAVQNLLLASRAAGLAAALTTLPLWSRWEARRTLGLPRDVTAVAVVPVGWPRGTPEPARVPPVGNVTHLDQWGHQPYRARARP
jgi:nitroreductase